jgi:hypothetical protein
MNISTLRATVRPLLQRLRRTGPASAPAPAPAPMESLPAIRHLKDIRPECYQACPSVNHKWPLAFVARDAADFDWLESIIKESSFYESVGPWGYGVDLDKRTMALIASYFSPAMTLDIGCNTGAVMYSMQELGLASHGIDISTFAKNNAPDTVRDNIFIGDILATKLPATYDLILGLDIFEHLNPNKLGSYLDQVVGLLNDNGYVFVNSPAWGADRIYDKVFPIEPSGYTDAYPSWSDKIKRRELFDTFPVDDNGFPHMGHLIWAGSAWWEQQFNDHGLYRQDSIEIALHRKFDWYFNLASIARRSFYILSRQRENARNEEVVSKICSWDKGSVVFR